MKHVWIWILLMVGFVANPLSASQFDDLKSLVGEWTAVDDDGVSVRAKYELISGGAVKESLKVGERPEMVTLYYPDGSSVMMTHFCFSKMAVRRESDDHVAQERTNRIDGQDVIHRLHFTRKREDRVLEQDSSCTNRHFAAIHPAPSPRSGLHHVSQFDSDCTRGEIMQGQKKLVKNYCVCRKCNCK